MFGMTATTAWELDAERRREQAMAWKAPRSTDRATRVVVPPFRSAGW